MFGSLAAGKADQYSDVDMLVAVDTPEAAWDIAWKIRQTLPVLFYRMFSSDRQPAGRYWFKDESPLTRLDISFHSPDSLQAICESRTYLQHPITWELRYQRDINVCVPVSTVHTQAACLTFTEMETRLGRCIYRVSCALACAARNKPYPYALDDCINALRDAMIHSQALRLAGGDGNGLALSLLQLADTLR
ncbi:MAG: nucleotidyltransferase domain-containing protein [Phycisphaeraceae bacterium JB051]